MAAANLSKKDIAKIIMREEAKNCPEIAPLHIAATLDLVSVVKSLLASGVDANARYGSGEVSALDVAALMGHVDVLRALVDHGVDVNEAGSGGETALHCAVIGAVTHGRADRRGHLIDLLLSAGADTNARTSDGLTPLHFAAGQPESGDAAAALLRRGAAKDAVNSAGRSALHMAAQSGHLAATRALLAAGADVTLRVDDLMLAPLDVAACCGFVEVVRELARPVGVGSRSGSGAGLSVGNGAPAAAGVGGSADGGVGVGVDVNASPDITGCTALHHAAWKNQAGVVDALVEAGASVAARTVYGGCTPLHFAAESLALEAMLALLRHGASPVRGATPPPPPPPLPPPPSPPPPHADGSQQCDGSHQGFVGLQQGIDSLQQGIVGLLQANDDFEQGDGLQLQQGDESESQSDGGVSDHLSEPPIHYAAQQAGKKGAAAAVDLLLRWGADEFELDDDGKTAAEVVGADVRQEASLAADADRVRELLANAPADRAWRRRGQLLMCLARQRRIDARDTRGSAQDEARGDSLRGGRRRRTGSTGGGEGKGEAGGKGKGKGVVEEEEEEEEEQGALVHDRGGSRGRKGVENRVEGGALKDGGGGDGGSSGGGGGVGNGGGGGNPEKGINGGDFDGVVASLLEFREEGFFRTIMKYL